MKTLIIILLCSCTAFTQNDEVLNAYVEQFNREHFSKTVKTKSVWKIEFTDRLSGDWLWHKNHEFNYYEIFINENVEKERVEEVVFVALNNLHFSNNDSDEINRKM